MIRFILAFGPLIFIGSLVSLGIIIMTEGWLTLLGWLISLLVTGIFVASVYLYISWVFYVYKSCD